MKEELLVLDKNQAWNVLPLTKGKKHGGCEWLFTIKYNSYGTVKRYKPRLVAMGFTQTYGVNKEALALVRKVIRVCVLLSPAVNCGWPLWQMDGKKCFFAW
eukprot:TRINITY_DN1448_c0_g1_i8.p1 TRINITY_DN1448_c0_g1~~TRINITY_DN1448_c0_g1_i8.p1  ORF type:complete len:101 (-),score=20.02 TRINITY_DN1448_c0_g1_i8:363-665(-)